MPIAGVNITSIANNTFSGRKKATATSNIAWHENLREVAKTRDVIVIVGNIRDLYVYSQGAYYYETDFAEFLVRFFWSELGRIRRFDIYLKAAELALGDGNIFVSQALEEFGASGFNDTFNPLLTRVYSELTIGGTGRVWMFPNAHNMLPYRSNYSPEENVRLTAIQNLIEHIKSGNKLFLCYLSDTQVPAEITQEAHRVGIVRVPMPEYDERFAFWRRTVDEAMARELAKLTDGMALTSLHKVVAIARANLPGDVETLGAVTLRNWKRAVSVFKFGDRPDPYRQITVDQLDHAFETFTEIDGIQGQDHALKKVVAMLWKARTNISALLHAGASAPPRGVMCFVGPSGVGKTYVAKRLAHFVFGSEEAFHRIDMSEYQQDFTVSGLIGPPPGYVGYERGGVLTNAVLRRPFAVLLFDEFEKAAPRVFDLLLQVLSDGRLTDSRGQTVFFSETIIILTSNIGCRSSEAQQLAEAQQSGQPERVQDHFIRCVRNFFRYEISRPELLNRIGNNIVPFNFLDREEVLTRTVQFYLNRLRDQFNLEYAGRKLSLVIDMEAVSRLLVERHGAAIREFGGRAVLNILEDALLPLLAQHVLQFEDPSPSRLVAIQVSVGVEEGRREIRVQA